MSTPSAWDYFSVEELKCHCGKCSTWFMNADFMEKMVKIRKFYNRPLTVTSGYRCPEHDGDIGTSASPGSGPHTLGRALDINIWGNDLIELLEVIGKLDLITGIGLDQKHGQAPSARLLHVDDIGKGEQPGHPRPAIWTY